MPIDAPADRTLHQTLPGGRDLSLGAAGTDQGEQCVGVIAAIGNDVAALETLKQVRCGSQIVGLPCGQHDADWQAVFVNHRIDLGAQSSTRATDGVILTPFFPPAAC